MSEFKDLVDETAIHTVSEFKDLVDERAERITDAALELLVALQREFENSPIPSFERGKPDRLIIQAVAWAVAKELEEHNHG